MGLKVVIPVAGVGERLKPSTHTRPKVLVHVAGKPMLGHILDELRKYDVDEITLIVGYRGDDVRRYCTENFPFRFSFVEQETMEGLGHAIWLSAEKLRGQPGPLLVILGDTLFEADFGKILSSSENWIGVREVEDPRRFGVVVLEDDHIKTIVEKPKDPPTKLAVVGIYVFQNPDELYSALDHVVQSDTRTAGEIQLTDALQRMIDHGCTMKPFEIEQWLDCGKPETLIETNGLLLELLAKSNAVAEREAFANTVIIEPVAIAPGSHVENSVIGPNVSVGARVRITGSIVSDCVISDDVEIADAILRESIVADHARVTGSAARLNIGDASEVRLG